MGYNFKKIDIFNIFLLFFALLSYIIPFGSYKIFLWLFVGFTALRVIILLKRKILWKTRNRLVFSGLFFVITPLFFMTVLFIVVSTIMMNQYGINIINNMMDLQLKSLTDLAKRNIERYESSENPDEILKKEIKWLNKRLIENEKTNKNNLVLAYLLQNNSGGFDELAKTVKTIDVDKIVKIKDLSGYFLLNSQLYFGAIQKGKKLMILSAIKIDQEFFSRFVSKISDFSVQFKNPGKINNINNLIGIGVIKEAETDNIYTLPLRYRYKYINFDKNNSEGVGALFINLNISKMYQKWKKDSSSLEDSNILVVIYVLIAIFGCSIIISFFVGFKILRVITRSINQLTKGTHKIRNGDFSFRIKIRSRDQLQYLAESFNEMASGINRLLIEEKEKQRLEEELRIARNIQEKLLPDESFETEEFEISAVNIPAEEIAGDYFDYYYKKDDFLTLILADVSGKGASAAFYMAELKGLNNHLRKTDINPAKLTSEFHYSLVDTFDKVTFITMSIAKFKISEKEFIFSRAGHTKGIYYNKKINKCQELFPNGIAIGVPNFTEDKIKEINVKYGSGDVLILFSDGLSEIMNKKGDMYGIERITSVLKKNKDMSANTIKDMILESSEIFAQDIPNQDDLTLMVLKVK